MKIELCENVDGHFFIIFHDHDFAAVDSTISHVLNISIEEYRNRLKTFIKKSKLKKRNTYLILKDSYDDEENKYYVECFKKEFAVELSLLLMGGWV